MRNVFLLSSSFVVVFTTFSTSNVSNDENILCKNTITSVDGADDGMGHLV